MEYYHIMMLLGGLILYMLLNIYPIIVYIIGIIKKRDFKELLNMPFEIIILLVPILGSLYGLLIVDFENKYYLVVLYIGMYLMLLGMIIDLIITFIV